jgi:hypothetical protein
VGNRIAAAVDAVADEQHSTAIADFFCGTSQAIRCVTIIENP